MQPKPPADRDNTAPHQPALPDATLNTCSGSATPPSAPAPAPAVTAGAHFRLLRPHAQGGLGRVGVALDEQLQREVALKEIREEFADDPRNRARFVQEAEVTARLEHPGIVPVYALGHHLDGRPFYVMRFVRGDSLQEDICRFHDAHPPGRISDDSRLGLRRLLERFLSVCQTIAYSHSCGVLHRDLKPANILLGPYGETLVVDWGLAKVVGRGPVGDDLAAELTLQPPSGEGSLTQAGSAMGTPAFMSPEQATGSVQLGPVTDVYGLGATLYALLTGVPPCGGGTVAAVLERVRTGDFPPPRSLRSDLSLELERICRKALALRPADRYATVTALASDLESCLAFDPLLAPAEALTPVTGEQVRIDEIRDDFGVGGWRRWGPYLSDRAWGTVREDYSGNGDVWNYLPHDLARSKAYRWGEDGIAGISDRYQFLCFAFAFWNEKDPILKERFFGLTPQEGNHGEDVKEYYFHLDNLPGHTYMKLLYKYPQAEFPYRRLIDENRRRDPLQPEYELLDTGVFDDDRYFDLVIEYAKATPEDFCIRIEAFNRGPEAAPLHIIPHLWFRNIWGWACNARGPDRPRSPGDVGRPPEPEIRPGPNGAATISICTDDTKLQTHMGIPVTYHLGGRTLTGPSGGIPLFTDNETNAPRVYGPGAVSRKEFVKDAFHRFLVNGEKCVNPARRGTKACIDYRFEVPPGGSAVLRLRFSDEPNAPLEEVDRIVAERKAEADEFYAVIHKPNATADEKLVQRQAFAGLLWSKQSYLFNVQDWLKGDCDQCPPPESRWDVRNRHWWHLNSMRIMTVPDKWEYPWFAAWDLAFQCVAFALIDPKFAKEQLWLLLFEQFQHPNGQIPANEWEFSDLHPPVHAWAVWRVYNMDRLRNVKLDRRGNKVGDRNWLERCFQKLNLNFVWWMNKVDREGNNIFEGGFLGLDNITLIDRSEKLPQGAVPEQADATAWMGMFCLSLMRIALELAKENQVYEGLASKFFMHYAYVAMAMKHMGNGKYQLWDEEDGFFYDALRFPNGDFRKFRVRSLLGLIPLFAVERLEGNWIAPFKEFSGTMNWFLKNRRDLTEDVVHKCHREGEDSNLLTIISRDQLVRIMQRLWNTTEFLSDYGIRSLSKAHEGTPFALEGKVVGYEPSEAVSKIKGGNSNWRGPIWMPTAFLIIESLRKLGKAWGESLTLTTPASNGKPVTFNEMAREIANRLIRIFTRDVSGRRPVYGNTTKFQTDPHWRDHLLFFEYFHGDTGAGLGASHQTGWTALVASLIDEWR